MRFNTPPVGFLEKTHEGAPAARLNAMQQLRRSVCSCLLGEDEFYEDGKLIMDRIAELAAEVPVQQLADLCVEVRSKFNLRHVPLWLLVALIKRQPQSSLVSETIANTIQRADEMGELLALYWRGGKRPMAAQLRKGLALAFPKFSPYALAKYNRDSAIKLRDVLFLAHPKPKNDEQQATWDKLVKGELESPDTWEVALSGGADKKETFERLIREGNLGYLALLRNLRNMAQAGCDTDLVRDAIIARKNGAERVLPFRYVAAARAAPQFEPALDQALCEAIASMPVLPGKTVVLVDVSGSMDTRLSAKSDLNRIDAAAALASIIPGDLRVFSFSDRLVEVPPRRGMAGVDAVLKSQMHSGTRLGAAIQNACQIATFDRMIVITDEQSHDAVYMPKGKRNYIINVASNKNGVGYGDCVRIDGFSEAVLSYIAEYERATA